MSQNCNCDTPSVEMPVLGLKLSLPESVFPNPGEPGTPVNTWQSGWFDITATSSFDFAHNLGLEKPWLCMPRIVGRVKDTSKSGGWMTDEFLFCDGENYIGATSASSFGWVISVDANTAHVAFGNYPNHLGVPRAGGGNPSIVPKTSVQCKLVISY